MEKTFGKYELIDRIGKGGMAEVFLAKSVGAQGLEKQLVIKRILPELSTNQRFIEMFIAEAKIAMGLNHPNIVQIYDFGRVEGDYYLAMEYVEGVELGRLLSVCGQVREPMPLGAVVYLAMEVARGLDYAHRRVDSYGDPLGIVHRDISPQNLLISRDGSIKIVDFGIAKAASVTDDSPDVVKGKYQYMSPEQTAGGEVDHRSDIFSLGAVIYEMIFGRPLFQGDTPRETMSLVLSAVVPELSALGREIPDPLEHLLYKALARDRGERFGSARELQVELTRILYSMGEIHDATTVAQYMQRLEQRLPERTLELRVQEDGQDVQTVQTRAPRTIGGGGTPLLPPTGTPLVAGPLTLAKQRKDVVILSGWLQGLLEHQEDPRFEHYLAEVERIVDSIAYKNGAVIHELNAAGFTLILGIPLSGENDEERGVQMALDLEEAVEGLGHDFELPLKVGLGLVLGEVLLEYGLEVGGRQYSWDFRDQGLKRSRLLARAALQGGGFVDIGEGVAQRIERTYRVAPLEGGGEFAEEGYRILGRKSARERIQELRQQVQFFHGREIPLRSLRGSFQQVLLRERAQGFLLLGPTGVGKSALLEKFVSGLNPKEVRVVRAMASPQNSEVPLASALGFFSEMLRVDLGQEVHELQEQIRARVEGLFQEESREERRWLEGSLFYLFGASHGGGYFEELSGEERRRRLFLTLRKTTNRMAAHLPVVLAVDDLHFVDPVMREFTAQYFNQAQKAPVFLVGTALDRGPHLESRSWKALLRAKNIHVEELGELSVLEAEAMIRRRLEVHGEVDEALVQAVLERSGGNPMYIAEVLDVLHQQGQLERLSQGLGDSGALDVLPPNLEGVIRARQDGLSTSARDALQRVSLLRPPFLEVEAQAVLGGHSLDILEELLEQRILGRDEGDGGERNYYFGSSLIQEVAARSLVPEEAERLHGEIAEFLEALEQPVDGELIAYHLRLAGRDSEAVALLISDLQGAFESFGAAECLRRCEKILAHPGVSEEQQFQTLLWRERSLDQLAEREGVEETLRRLEELAPLYGTPSEQAEVAIRRGRYHLRDSQLELARGAIGEALEIARRHDDRLAMAQAWRSEAVMDLTDGERGRALGLIDRGIATVGVLSERGAQLELVKAYNIRGAILRQSGRHREALEAYETALIAAGVLESPSLIRQLLVNSGLALAYLGEYSEAKERYERALKTCRRLGHRRDEALVLVNLGHLYQLLGDYERAGAYIRRGIYLARQTEAAMVVADGEISLGYSFLESGELKLAGRYLERGLAQAQAAPHAYLEMTATLGLAQLYLCEEALDLDRAQELAQAVLARSEDAGVMWGVATANEILARIFKERGELAQALVHTGRAVKILEEVDIYGIDQILLTHYQVLLGLDSFEEERLQVASRVYEVYRSRRDAIWDEADRRSFEGRRMSEQIRQLAQSVSIEEPDEVVEEP